MKKEVENVGMVYCCDGCGKEKLGFFNGREWFKPQDWYEREDKDGVQLACSRTCIETIAKRTGKTNVVLPI